jgi:hypothetical protein
MPGIDLSAATFSVFVRNLFGCSGCVHRFELLLRCAAKMDFVSNRMGQMSIRLHPMYDPFVVSRC